MTGNIGFWLRIALIVTSGAFVSQSGVQLFDPATGIISFHVDDLGALATAVVSLAGWKGWHSWAQRKGGKL